MIADESTCKPTCDNQTAYKLFHKQFLNRRLQFIFKFPKAVQISVHIRIILGPLYNT